MKMEAVLGGISLFPTVVFVAWGWSRLRLDVMLAGVEPCCEEAIGCERISPYYLSLTLSLALSFVFHR